MLLANAMNTETVADTGVMNDAGRSASFASRSFLRRPKAPTCSQAMTLRMLPSGSSSPKDCCHHGWTGRESVIAGACR